MHGNAPRPGDEPPKFLKPACRMTPLLSELLEQVLQNICFTSSPGPASLSRLAEASPRRDGLPLRLGAQGNSRRPPGTRPADAFLLTGHLAASIARSPGTRTAWQVSADPRAA
jgi:hypothetical protein